jgi:hypothetical protein
MSRAWQADLHENGVLVSFVESIDPTAVANLANHFAQVWNYRYSPGYGSPEMAPSHPGVVGHEAVAIAGVHAIDDRTLFVEMPDLQPVNQLHLVLQVKLRIRSPWIWRCSARRFPTRGGSAAASRRQPGFSSLPART